MSGAEADGAIQASRGVALRARGPLLAPDWYRVACLRPRLRSGIAVSRQQVRGETWYVLSDPVSGRHHRFNDLAYGLIGSCDGEKTLDEVWAARLAADGDAAPTQNETIHIFAQAFAANLFIGDVAPQVAAIIRTHSRTRSRRRREQLNPFAFRVSLWDPDRFLTAQLRWVAWSFSLGARLAAGFLIAVGALLLVLNADAVSEFAQHELGHGRMLLVMWLIYPVMKSLHELAHAFAVKLHGGEVHEIGITLLMLTPVPYVDASASVAFADKRQRIDVAVAGIVVEALLASLALILWLLLEPGLAKEVTFAMVFVGALSTLAVNGNPLLRFDGYYVLCDAAELPNLAQRSLRYWKCVLKRHLIGLVQIDFGGCSPGERAWLLAYAPLSWAFRTLLIALLVVLAAEWSGSLGLVVLAVGAWLVVLKPAFDVLRWVAQSGEVRGHRPRAAAAALAVAFLVGVVGFGLPMPQRTLAPGVVWLPDDAMIRLGADGLFEGFLVRDGDVVATGTPIARLRNEPLVADLAGIEAQLERQRVERALQFHADAGRAAAAADQLARLEAERDRLVERVDALVVRAGLAGRIVIDPQRVIAGQYRTQGDLIAQVLPGGPPLVRALIRNEDIALVRERPGAITVELAHAGGTARRAAIGGAIPEASSRLPTPALGEAAGGSVALDPTDETGRTAREPRFQFDLTLDAGVDARIGSRAQVTFRHGETHAIALLGQFLRQAFLRHLER